MSSPIDGWDMEKLLQFIFSNNVVILLLFFIALVIVPIIMVMLYIKSVTRDRSETRIIRKKEDITSEYTLYCSTYIIPFLTEEPLQTYNLVALFILMTTISIIYARANLFYVNPLLSILGYKIYKVNVSFSVVESDSTENTLILITKKSLKLYWLLHRSVTHAGKL